jgi:hypothetical protein
MMKRVNVFLFSEMEEENGDVTPVQYELTEAQFHELIYCVEHDLTILRFGNFFHHNEDIIKFVLID